MTPLKRNIIANFAGQGWAALMAFAFVPLYIKYLGIEAYGLIGFYAMLQGAFQILDLGLSQMMSREMAHYSVLPEKAAESRNFVRTLETGYWTIGIILGVAVVASASFIATYWIKSSSISIKTVQQAVMIMGVVSALQWPLSFYEGGLMGLQKQLLSNSIKIVMTTLGSCGAVFILWKVSPTITAFFTWQIAVSALYVGLYTVFLWRSLPTSKESPRFDFGLLHDIRHFAMGMGGIMISSMVLAQLDRVILSKLLDLEMFGYYTLACIASSVIPALIARPVFNALFPSITSLVTTKDESALRLLYHQGSQLMAVLILPVAAVMAFFSFDILLLWTGDAKAAGIASPIVSILVVGMALNGFTHLPYSLQIAHRWTRIGLYINLFFIVTLIPAIFFMTIHYGAVGAATVWAILNLLCLMISVPLTHRRFLKGEMWRWCVNDIALPLTASLVATGVSRWLFTSSRLLAPTLVSLFTALFVAFIATTIVASHTRTWLWMQLSKVAARNSQL